MSQTLAAAAVVVVLYFLWARNSQYEGYEGQRPRQKVIPLELPVQEAATSLYKNINQEMANYLKPAADATNRLASLRPNLKVDKSIVNVLNTIRQINSSNDNAATKMMKIADALPPSVDTYKTTYDNLIHAALNEYELISSSASSTGLTSSGFTSGFIDMSPKSINEYNRISNTRMNELELQDSSIKKAADDFEVAFARLRALLEQSK